MNKKGLLVLLLLPLIASCASGDNTNTNIIESASSSITSSVSQEVSLSSSTVSEASSLGESLASISFTQNGVNVIEASGWLESCYVKWEKVNNASRYEVLYNELMSSTILKANDYLIREYDSYFRVDIPGLAKGQYVVTITAYDENNNALGNASQLVNVKANIREGFGFLGGSASGAYKDDGTLQENADVIYVTSKNAKTVSLNVEGKTYTGIQAILKSKQDTASTKPLCIRVIGRINKADLDYCGSSAEGLQVKGKAENSLMNVTIEGIGDDAYFYGFGILIRNCQNVEVRNLGFIEAMDDCVSVDSDNSHLWIHNNDFFYGHNQGGDKSKGDGALDTKASTLITHSFNHFWDSGKCNLQGMSEEKSEYSITYHHNWYDHSDSRHPRVRVAQVHTYNNYYDGNAKYGIGATTGCSVFVENNYFRNCKHPMLISMQGSDIASSDDGKGTFSSEDGGMIKAYNNYQEGGMAVVTYQENSTEFDCYAASSKDEVVPSSVVTKQGGHTYNNFDTSSSMYTYNVESPQEAKENVVNYAGRVNGGDFKFTFTADQDTNYALIPELVSELLNYKSSLVSIQAEKGNSSSSDEVISSSEVESPSSEAVIEGELVHNFTTSGLESSLFTINGNLSTSKGSVTYNDLTLTQCLKMESSTSISFTISSKMTLTLVFNDEFNGKVKIDGTKYTCTNGILTLDLEQGSHTITKGDSANLYYMSLK